MKKNMIDAVLDLAKSVTENKEKYKDWYTKTPNLQMKIEDLKDSFSSITQTYVDTYINDGYFKAASPAVSVVQENTTNDWYHAPSQDHFKKVLASKYYPRGYTISPKSSTTKPICSPCDDLLKNNQMNINKEVIGQINLIAKQLLREEKLGNIKYIEKSSKNRFLSVYFSKYKIKLKNNLYKLENLIHSLNDRISI